MDSGFDKRGDRTLPGSALRNEAASYLETIYDKAEIEVMLDGKKVDVVVGMTVHGKSTELLVEVKDYASHLDRNSVSGIFADYTPLLDARPGSQLLIVTRRGLAPAARTYVEGNHRLFHQTIWELEDAALGLMPYVRAQTGAFDEGGLSSYYMPARARLATYDGEQRRSLSSEALPLLEVVEQWIEEPGAPPLAILGGYGAGKSSFAHLVLSRQAAKALEDPAARRPILVRLGSITRSMGLDSLLGALFTSTYEIRGYSFRRLCDLNEKGRLLVILDGFDEMKHAMSWTEFVAEIAELNQLNRGDARVLLLGRPSAFTSDDEHMEVLRGRRRIEGGTRKLQDWPEFREYELEAFSRDERAEFVIRFLEWQRQSGGQQISLAADAANTRADEVNRIADLEQEVFAKPVHAKILVELALDPEFDLSSFSSGVTRWSLYSEFFHLLARREMTRPARRPIEAKHRLDFLRRVALWLWRERDGSTSFRAEDLPARIFDGLADGGAESIEDKRREYLAGAFLERKSKDTYYFPHRSFAEFLVAEHLAMNPPSPRQHGDHDALSRDGVAEFLASAPAERDVAGWAVALTREAGSRTIDYFLMLSNVAGHSRLAERMPERSPYLPFVRLLETAPPATPIRERIVTETVRGASDDAVALLISCIDRFSEIIPTTGNGLPETGPLQELALSVTAALLTRIVAGIREPHPIGRVTVEEKMAPLLSIAQSGIQLQSDQNSRHFVLSWRGLADAASKLSKQLGPDILASEGQLQALPRPEIRLPYAEVRRRMADEQSDYFHQMVLRRGSLATISVVSQVTRRPNTPSR